MDARPDLAPLGLGLAALGRPAYITVGRAGDLGGDRDVATMRDRAHAMLDAAWARGIRFIDAARSYGRAEEFLGSWLAAHPDRRTHLTIESKWGYAYVGDSNVVETYISYLRRKLNAPNEPDLIQTVRGSGYRLGG